MVLIVRITISLPSTSNVEVDSSTIVAQGRQSPTQAERGRTKVKGLVLRAYDRL